MHIKQARAQKQQARFMSLRMHAARRQYSELTQATTAAGQAVLTPIGFACHKCPFHRSYKAALPTVDFGLQKLSGPC